MATYNKKLVIKQGFLTDFVATVRDSDGDVVDLSAYDSVKFIMVDRTTEAIKINSAGSFINKTEGTVTYSFVAVDVDTVGFYKAYFAFYTGADKKLSSPPTYFEIQIVEDYLP